MESRNLPKIGITIGDISGISIEIILKTFADNRMYNLCTPIIYGSSRAISYYRKVLEMEDFEYQIISHPEKAKPNVCNVINCWENETPITIGKPNPQLGALALKALDAASKDIKSGQIDGIVTAPINKKHLSTDQVPFVGQTEYFTDQFPDQESVMMLCGDGLRVGLVTNHIAVSQISQHLTQKKINQKLTVIHNSLVKDFGIVKPIIAVLGLNPHAGDNGLFGREEIEIITPVIKKAKEKGQLVYGPFPADGLFGSNNYKNYDAILAMFHDQGLVAFKALTFGTGVNYTAGLPIVRTSPDHGTAYDIAGKGIASESSFREAIFMAMDVIRNRANHEEMYQNPLSKKDIVQQEEIIDENEQVNVTVNNNNDEEEKPKRPNRPPHNRGRRPYNEGRRPNRDNRS